VETLARVEGEGSLHVTLKNGKVSDLKLQIYEPPRFFEALLRDRRYDEAPDITARICGICPVAYQMSSCHAMEAAFGVDIDPRVRALRRLLYCGEWIESHALHVYLLHAPDFLGYESAIHLAQDHPEVVKQALRLKKLGNEIMKVVGGREIHPINVRVGGFYKAPAKKVLQALLSELEWALATSLATVKFTAGLSFPDFEQDYEFVALRHPDEYPLNEGRLVSNRGLDIAVADYEDHFAEDQVPHSNALHSILKGRGNYLVGPLARYNLNYDRLPQVAREAAEEAGLGPHCLNPFKSIIVRSVELVFACHEALRLIHGYQPPDPPAAEVAPRAGVGHGCTEAPRGILYHRYRLDEQGLIQEAKIVPPTSQNQKTIENDLWHFVPDRITLPQDQLTWQCEQAVRNYDPCISCATHFLRLTVGREDQSA
jgi:coenzyme F420-reducing hydrogenase alpha subunit